MWGKTPLSADLSSAGAGVQGTSGLAGQRTTHYTRILRRLHRRNLKEQKLAVLHFVATISSTQPD